MRFRLIMVVIAAWLGSHFPAWGDEPSPTDQQASSQEELFKKFESTLSGAALTGHFTITGKEDMKPREETYEIQSVKKMETGDYWLFMARVKYGDKDVTLPLPLPVKWAGDTPVITLTNLTIPLLGTFSSRVVIYDGKYAGTWQHGKVGGHLYGTINKTAPEEKKEAEEAPQP